MSKENKYGWEKVVDEVDGSIDYYHKESGAFISGNLFDEMSDDDKESLGMIFTSEDEVGKLFQTIVDKYSKE